MVWLSGGNMTILWLFPRGQFCVWTFKNDRMEWGSLFSDKAKSVTFTCWNSSAKVKLGSGREGGISVAGIGTLGHWRLLICEFMTFHDLCCCSMSFLYVGSIPHSNRICSEFGSNAISSTQRCLTTPGTVKMLGAALAPWQNALLVSCWTITSIGGVYGVFVKTRNKGYCQGHAMCWYHRFGFQIRTSASIPRISCCNGRGLQWLWYREQPNKGAVLQWRGFQDNDNQQDQANLSETAAPLPSMPYLLHKFQQHQITKWSIVLQNITQSCLEIFAIFLITK